MSLGKTIESLIDAGMTPNEAIRASGSICSGGPLGPEVKGAIELLGEGNMRRCKKCERAMR